LIIFVVALSLRLAYLASRWSLLPDWNVDAIGYHQLAVNLIQRGIFSLNTEAPFQPDSIRTPAFPVFIALIYLAVGVAPRAIVVVQAILDSITALIAMGIAANLGQPKYVIVGVGLLYAFYVEAWRYSAELYVEVVLAFCVTLVFLIVSRIRIAPGASDGTLLGGACGLALLVKPTLLLLPVILGAALLIEHRFRQALLFAAVLGVVLAPWVMRNAAVFGRPMLSSALEDNLALVSAPATMAEARGEIALPWTVSWEALFAEVIETAARRNPELFAVPANARTPQQTDQVTLELAETARDIIAAHPAAFVASHLKGAARGLRPQEHRFWFEQLSGQRWDGAMPDGLLDLMRDSGWGAVSPLASLLSVIYVTFYIAGGAALLIGLWRLSRRDRIIAVAVGFFIIYMLILPGPIAYERFRIPIMPLAFALMGCALYPRGHNGEFQRQEVIAHL
jgi:hypothetical protein